MTGYLGRGISKLRDSIVPTAAVGGASSTFGSMTAAVPLAVEPEATFPAWKRCLDVAVSLPALGLSLPIFGVAALAMRASGDRGPVFFRAVRVGEGGRPFEVLKLRTMRTQVDGPAVT